MKFTHAKSVALSVAVILVMLFNLGGCTVDTDADNLMKNFTPNKVTALEDLEDGAAAFNTFSVEFFKNCHTKGKNSLISPLSAVYALGMTANGANGETLTQMENTLGMKKDDLNLFLYSLAENLRKDKGAKFNLANSVWFTDSERFTVGNDFLQLNADYYGADIYREPFDSSTVKKVNNWVNDKTNGMMEDIINDSYISENSIMYLINALCFEGKWIEPYEDINVREGEFTTAAGDKRTCEFMYGEELHYIEDGNATGFIKPYKDSNYAFAAILPEEGITADEYVASLTGEKLTKMLSNSKKTFVTTAIPKFEAEFDFEISEALENMGMTYAFDVVNADFSGLGSSDAGNIYIKGVKQKTYISVAEKGTKAGAATISCFYDKSAGSGNEMVCLERPFVYMIIDTNTNVPLFMGIMNNV